MADIGRIIGGGFALLGRRPLAAISWGAIGVVTSAVIGVAQLHALDIDPQMLTGAMQPGTTPPAFGWRSFAIQTGFGLLALVVSTVLWAAAFRAVLHPGAGGFASLRLGADELRLLAVTLILYLLFVVGGLFVGLGFGFVAAFFGFAAGSEPGVLSLLLTLLAIALVCGIVFLGVRLSLVTPLVIERERVGIDESWELTRGHFWSLLGAYILMGLIFLAMALLLALPAMGATVSLLDAETTPQPLVVALDRFFSGETPEVDAALAIQLLVALVLEALRIALLGGMLATAVLELIAVKGWSRGADIAREK